ncbi:hypothetical protein F9L16_03820 [Agarivorans sp. B2Z047]|uniref:RNA-directed DNA polymerase n=1 Tax=Agarivorans sp. B2Z047 TaxID=2652721 RepID=UPI00128C6B76|nr:RNA-directed DNA polymerase [Agarivorans sp. B2Z047]MPW28124.1 hypothetical protein [Agarivorans sp. B2Z047]UQN44045.1 RNA-directed DNA polymerase [Agarivorans sp. B2Z047]
MNTNSSFSGWHNLTIQDLLIAYRKAKADCFFEDTFPTAIKFAEYEQDLLNNLNNLLEELKKRKGFKNDKRLLGECRLLPKKLDLQNKKDISNCHIHFSDPERAFDNLIKTKKLTPSFRVVGDFPVDTHVISALWINLIGHKFDASLDDNCYGARLRRIRSEEELDKGADKPFHISAIGSFRPYFEPYQRWRKDGLNAIRGELDKNRDVIAVSLDLKSYYHQIDPTIISSKVLAEYLGLSSSLSKEDEDFNRQIAAFMKNWSDNASSFSKKLGFGNRDKVNGGLTIGLTASRIISNVLLHKWDKLIVEKVTPIHYGRYVDDMFIVLRDSGEISNTDDLMKLLQSRLGKLGNNKCLDKKANSIWRINLNKNYQNDSVIELQANKQKLFILNGQAGKDLLDSIEHEIQELSSEHRLMPSPDQLENTIAAGVLSASASIGEHADNLRRADGLTIRRLSWSLQLSHVETLARDLPKKVWQKEREDFYSFAHNHIVRADNIFAHYTYLPRLLSFAVSLEEWNQAELIVNRSFAAISKLQEQTSLEKSKVVVNGQTCSPSKEIWNYVFGSLAWAFIDAAARSYAPEKMSTTTRTKRESKLAKTFLIQLYKNLDSSQIQINPYFKVEEFYNKAPLLASADLARTPYKSLLKKNILPTLLEQYSEEKDRYLINEMEKTGLVDTSNLIEFLKLTRSRRLPKPEKGERTQESYRPYLFPTRPYTPAEIAELEPRCVGIGQLEGKKPPVIWANYVKAIRGVWVKPTLISMEQLTEFESDDVRYSKPLCKIGNDRKNKIIVAITNMLTTDKAWADSASGKPLLSLNRYKRISAIVNNAVKITPKPDYLVFPELSLPIDWVQSVSSRLSRAGISLIAGTEYRHFTGNKLVSQACLHLADNRLGFPSSVRIWQNKLQPAPAEDKELISKHGKYWKASHSEKPIYIHNDFHFGVMVCSELQNSKARIAFQGEVDALMILSWNQDLDTFSSLVEAAALDVHTYAILVNNSKYGDSRVRAPSKESFKRDLARLRGGENDFCVTVELDVSKLRTFQSRAKRWPDNLDPFKPVPEGFKISKNRKLLPAK